MNATEKQISFALSLLAKAGYNAKWMDAKHKELGASMRERSGLVVDWLKRMNRAEISQLIDRLKEKAN